MQLTYDCVMDVGGPHSGKEQQDHMGEVVHRENEQAHNIRRRLEGILTISSENM